MWPASGQSSEVDGFAASELVVELFGQERRERRHHQAELRPARSAACGRRPACRHRCHSSRSVCDCGGRTSCWHRR